LFLTIAQPTRAQSSAPAKSFTANDTSEPRLLRALVDGMRQLRLTLEMYNLRQLRSTLVLERLKRQDARVETLNSDLKTTRKQIRELVAAGRYNDEHQELKEVETAISETDDQCARAQFTQEYNRLKHALERRKKTDIEELERQRALETQIDTQLQTEQARFEDLNSQLEALEREMDQQIAEVEKTQVGRK
jgi:chromosome segregation ATPase